MLFLQHVYNKHMVWRQHGSFGEEQGAVNQYARANPVHFRRHTRIVPNSVFNQHRYTFCLAMYQG